MFKLFVHWPKFNFLLKLLLKVNAAFEKIKETFSGFRAAKNCLTNNYHMQVHKTNKRIW